MDRLNTFVSRGDARDHCKTSGALEVSTQQWLVDQATAATAAGRYVIAMMHHHLVPHFHMEETLAAPYMVGKAQQLCHRLIDAGVHAIFTGHLHISDVCQTTHNGHQMVEIATAAAVGYPCQWRLATCNTTSGKMQLRSITLHSLPSDSEFGEHAREVFQKCIPTMTHGVIKRYWPEIRQAIDSYSAKHSFMMRFVDLPDTSEALADAAHALCLQIAANSPKYIDVADVPQAEIDAELEIKLNALKEQKGKLPPEQALVGIKKGMAAKFCTQICLLKQDYVADGEVTVEKYLDGVAKNLGDTLTVKRFVRLQLGA